MLDSIDPDTLRQVAIGGIVVLGLLMLFVFFTVQKLIAKLLLIGILVGAGALVWWQRAELADCAQTCNCKFFSFETKLPASGC